MESTPRKKLMLVALLFSLVSYRLGAEEISNNPSIKGRDTSVAASIADEKKGGGGGGVYGGGGCGWGWGGPGGSSGGGGGGGGSGYWKCQCKHSSKKGKHQTAEESEEYRMREFGECTARGKCRGMRLDCPLNCGGPCVYDCTITCKAYCKS